MPSPAAVMRGIVQRLLPSPFVDDRDNDKPARYNRYGEQDVISLVRKNQALSDEGSYFVTHNAQTGVISSLIGTAFAQTTISPFLLITNTENAGGKSVSLDYVNLICTVVGAAASGLTNMNCAWSTDQSSSRYTSGGVDITGVPAAGGGSLNTNTGVSKRASVAQINAGVLTLTAATSAARIIVPQRLFRVTNSGTVAGAVQDEVRMNFGGVEPNISALLDTTTAKTVGYREILHLPPIVIAPGHCAILHLWSPGAAVGTTGITYLPEIGHWER